MASDPTKKSNRGGKRTGAGRKPKGHKPSSALSDLDLKTAEAASAATPQEVELAARVHARASLETLKTVMLYSESESARVRAANAILDRGFGKPATDTGLDMALPLFDQVFLKTAPGEVMEEARKLAALAIQVLHKIAENSASHAARVAASTSLLDRGLGAVAVAKLEAYRANQKAIGKKAEALEAAHNPDTNSPMGELMARRQAMGNNTPNVH